MGSLGFPELIVILVIIIMIFGANRLPDIGRGIGKGIRNFKEATREGDQRPRQQRLAARAPASAPPPVWSRVRDPGIQQRDRELPGQSIPALEACDIHVSLGASLP